MVTIFCAIVDVAGSPFPVDIDASLSVGHLKKAVKAEKTNYLKDVDADELNLFLAKAGGNAWLSSLTEDVKKLKKGEKTALVEALMKEDQELQAEDSLEYVLEENNMPTPQSRQIHVLVVVPPHVGSKRPADDEVDDVQKRLRLMESDLAAIKPDLAAMKPKTLTEFTPLSVHEDEFRLDSLSMTRQSDDPIIMTPTLHEFWKGFGEFPPYYFVRMEEVVFWKVIKKLLFRKGRVVIVGSPGVGKSCFLMLIAFYLACIKREKVLVIRRLKEEGAGNAVVFLDRQKSYARLTNLLPSDLAAIRVQVPDAIVLVDGFPQNEADSISTGLLPFKLLATSCQFDAKEDDNSRIVVLPAWRDADLLQYAKLTNWVVDSGLRKIKRQNTPVAKLVREQYFYSGGSLREFCKERGLLVERVARYCLSVDNQQAFELVYNYGGGQSKSQVDRLRRHYITDCSLEVDYRDSRKWFLSVDSGYVLSQLGRKIDMDKQLKVYTHAKSVGAGFHGVAYELLLHNAVREAFVKRKPVVLKMREGSKYEKIEILAPNVVCSGKDEASCYPCLSTLRKDTYWYPDYPFFPFIDAVTTCEAFPSKSEADGKGQHLSNKSETIVAYIQVTIRSEKKFKEERLRRLNEEMDKNSSLKDMKRAFVVVGPDFGVCEMFDLRDAPDPNTFLTMVSCFSPEQLEPEVR